MRNQWKGRHGMRGAPKKSKYANAYAPSIAPHKRDQQSFDDLLEEARVANAAKLTRRAASKKKEE